MPGTELRTLYEVAHLNLPVTLGVKVVSLSLISRNRGLESLVSSPNSQR